VFLAVLSLYAQDSLIASYTAKIKAERTDTGRAMKLIALSNAIFNYDFNKSAPYANEAYAISTRKSFTKGIGKSELLLGMCELRKANYPKASSYLTAALKISQEDKDTDDLIRIYNSFAAIELALDLRKASIENSEKALELAKKSHNSDKELMLMMNILNFYLEAKDFNKGLAYGQDALQMARKVGNARDSAYIYDDIGMCYVGLEQYDKGRYYISRALATQKKLGYKRQQVVCLTNMGETYAREENLPKTLEYYNQALVLATEIADSQYVNMIQVCLGQIYVHFGRYREGIKYYETCKGYFQRREDYFQLGLVYSSLAEAYTHLKDYRNAYANEQLYAGTKDSLLQDSSHLRLSKVEKAYEISQHKAQLELLQSEKKLKEEQVAHQKQLMFLLGVLSLLVIALLIGLFNHARVRQRIKTQEELTRLERKALQLQMKPHFIFNALGSISGYIASNDTGNALKYLAKFSRLMRYTLESSELQTVSLGREIENLENYLKLEQMRFDHKFEYAIHCETDIQDDIQIPPMIIQPFLENAILHGITPKDGKGDILVSFSRQEDKLLCIVEDNGVGRQYKEEADRASMGIEITRKRLDILNADKVNAPSIWLEDLLDSSKNALGTRVTIQFYAS
jgi:tetratricopeptide (TPR) repeat protein